MMAETMNSPESPRRWRNQDAAAFWLAFLLLAARVLGQGPGGEPEHPFRFAFSSALMPDVNESDTRAALKVWTETLTRDGLVCGDTNVLFCPDRAGMLTSLQNRTADGVAVPTTEFLALREHVKFNRHIFGVTEGTISEEYVLLVHADSGLSRIENLQGHSLNVLRHSRMCLAMPWLDTVLLEKGLKPAPVFFGRVTEDSKLTKSVLPVFFRKADACLVPRKGFRTMGELNPQVNRQLRVLATSQEFVPVGFFFRAGYPQRQQDQFVAELKRVHARPSGQQVLTVFQVERLEEHPASVLNSAVALMEHHRRLGSGTTLPQVMNAELRLGPDAN